MSAEAQRHSSRSESNRTMRLPHHFILGCERSGSTWISNVLASHPKVEMFMEPFADYARIFPELPNRNIYLDTADEQLVQVVRAGYEGLPGLKYPYFYKPGRSQFLKKLDRLHSLVASHSPWIGKARSLEALRFELLNLAEIHTQTKSPGPKEAPKSCIITKELRLNFKIGLLMQVFPRAKCLIAIRHPCIQIDSIIRLTSEGRLRELGNALLSFKQHVTASPRFEKYLQLLSGWDQKAQEEKLIAWWVINYGVLLEDCDRSDVEYRIMRHEDLCMRPHEEFDATLEFLGLDPSHHVHRQIDWTSGSTRHSVRSPLDVRRDSSAHLISTHLQLPPYKVRNFARVIEQLALPSALSDYLGDVLGDSSGVSSHT